MVVYINNEPFKVVNYHRELVATGDINGWVTYTPGKKSLILESIEMGEE